MLLKNEIKEEILSRAYLYKNTKLKKDTYLNTYINIVLETNTVKNVIDDIIIKTSIKNIIIDVLVKKSVYKELSLLRDNILVDTKIKLPIEDIEIDLELISNTHFISKIDINPKYLTDDIKNYINKDIEFKFTKNGLADGEFYSIVKYWNKIKSRNQRI